MDFSVNDFYKHETTKLIAETYYDAAMAGTDMRTVTEGIEGLRGPLLSEHPFNVWNQIKLNNNNHPPYVKKLLTELKQKQRVITVESTRLNVETAFKESLASGWKCWFNSYLDAVIYWNGDVCHSLCEELKFPLDGNVVQVESLRKLNRWILESRWIDADPILKTLADHPETDNFRRAHLDVILGEIQLYQLLRNDEALEYFEKAAALMPDFPRIHRGFAEYHLKQGNFQESRKHINEAIARDTNNVENFILMGDTYKDEGKKSLAEQWYRDAITINFLRSDGYLKLISLYDGEQNSEKYIQEILSTIESIEPSGPTNNILYTAYRDVAYYYSIKSKYEQTEFYYKKAIDLQPQFVIAYVELAYIFGLQKKYSEAKAHLDKSLTLDKDYFDANFNCAWLAEQKGEFKEAIRLYEHCVSLRPFSAAVSYNSLGFLYKESQDYEAARNYYQKAIEESPKTALYYYHLGSVTKLLNDNAGTEAAYKKAVELEPQNAVYQNRMGNFYYELENYKKAIDFYLNAVRILPNEYVYHENLGKAYKHLNDYVNAIEAYERSIFLKPTKDSCNSLGILYYEKGNHKKAIENYKRAIELSDKPDAVLHSNLGLSHAGDGNYDQAEKEYLTALELEPGNYLNHNQIGVLYNTIGKYELAIKHYQEAIQLKKNDTPVLYENLGLAYEKQGLYQEALENYVKALAKLPNDGYLNNKAGVCCYRLNDIDSSIEYYKKAINADGNVAIYYENLGLSYNRLKLWDDAIEAYQIAISKEPMVETYNLLGIVYYELGDQNKAIENYKKALDLSDTKQGVVYYNLALSHELSGQTEEAETAFLNALALEPENYLYHNKIGTFYFGQYNYGAAIRHYKKAIAFGKGEDVLYSNLAAAEEEMNRSNLPFESTDG